MTSVRPKLKPETPKTVTAWKTDTGQNVWMTATGGWSADPSDLGVFTGTDADDALAIAQSQEGDINDPYFMEVNVEGAIAGRETLRETIRANGPTVPYGVIINAE